MILIILSQSTILVVYMRHIVKRHFCFIFLESVSQFISLCWSTWVTRTGFILRESFAKRSELFLSYDVFNFIFIFFLVTWTSYRAFLELMDHAYRRHLRLSVDWYPQLTFDRLVMDISINTQSTSPSILGQI